MGNRPWGGMLGCVQWQVNVDVLDEFSLRTQSRLKRGVDQTDQLPSGRLVFTDRVRSGRTIHSVSRLSRQDKNLPLPATEMRSPRMLAKTREKQAPGS